MALDENNVTSNTGLGKPVDSSRKLPAKYPEKRQPAGGGGGGNAPVAAVAAGPSGGFFTLHKRGQGYWTRMGTALGAALLGALTASFIYEQIIGNGLAQPGVAIAVAGGFLAGFALLCFWLMNKPTHVDFLIATDSEMKKVNWTSRKELIGSTKVVVFFMLIIASSLFLIDILFGYFFWLIRVLETKPF